MYKIHYDTLTFEVTRRCNMRCQHCLRGDAQCLDMPDEVIDKALENVSDVNNITFSGGEPTLNLHAIRHVLDVCKERNICVSSFFLATNGKEITPEFVHLMVDWYVYCQSCDSETFSSVALSIDKFHETIDPKNVFLLKALSFFNMEEKQNNFDRYPPIGLGRARNLPEHRERHMYVPDMDVHHDLGEIYFFDCQITVTSDGVYLPVCDYEYEEAERIAMGSVYENNAYEQLLMRGISDQFWQKIDAA